MENEPGRFARCRTCDALNLSSRSTCYRCHKPLPAIAWTPETAGAPAPPGRHRLRQNGRDSERHNVQISGAMLEGPGSMRMRGMVHDLSEGGCQFRTTALVGVGTRVRLQLPLEGGLHPVEGIVRYVRPEEQRGIRVYLCGIEFARVSPPLKRLIRNL